MGKNIIWNIRERRICLIEDQNDIALFLSEDVTHSAEYSNYAIATYCVLKILTTTKITKHCISPTQIGFYLTGDTVQPRRFINYIKVGLDELIKNNLLIKEGEIQKNYILDCSKLWIDTEKIKFTIITFQEILKIFKVKNVNNFLLLRYFIYLVGTFSSKIDVYINPYQHKTRVVGNFTIDYLEKITGISARSIIEYNKILESINLLYIYHQNDFTLDDEGNLKQLINVYGRYCDRAYIDTFAINQQKNKSSYKYVAKNMTNVNNRRRLAQMYLQINKNSLAAKSYTREDILDVYNYVLSENNKYNTLSKKYDDDSYLNKIRNVNVFEKYDFIKPINEEEK